MPTYYDTLGVTPAATAEQIKQAWLTLNAIFHPDRLNHLAPRDRAVAEERTAAINEAYQVLSDPDRRARYDTQLTWQPTGPDESAGGFGAPPDEAPHATWQPPTSPAGPVPAPAPARLSLLDTWAHLPRTQQAGITFAALLTLRVVATLIAGAGHLPFTDPTHGITGWAAALIEVVAATGITIPVPAVAAKHRIAGLALAALALLIAAHPIWMWLTVLLIAIPCWRLWWTGTVIGGGPAVWAARRRSRR